jgi:hypothetical protein
VSRKQLLHDTDTNNARAFQNLKLRSHFQVIVVDLRKVREPHLRWCDCAWRDWRIRTVDELDSQLIACSHAKMRPVGRVQVRDLTPANARMEELDFKDRAGHASAL